MDPLKITYKAARRIAIAIVGSTVLFLGVVMIVTPGPAFVFIPLGLAILGLEFAWARLWMRRLRQKISDHNHKSQAERAEAHRERHRE